jgi:ABC-type transport system involved in cytochrome bd biosynthesis fused ATPase/permease subunit
MSLITIFLINTASIMLGTFAANFGLLWIIGNQAKALEKKQMEMAVENHKKLVERVKEEVKKKQEYMRMES